MSDKLCLLGENEKTVVDVVVVVSPAEIYLSVRCVLHCFNFRFHGDNTKVIISYYRSTHTLF